LIDLISFQLASLEISVVYNNDSISVLERAQRLSPSQGSSQPEPFARQDEWLSQAIARHGPELWDRLVRSLPKNQADALRQQLEAFVYELEIAAIDDE
jgi:hypothetical protein